MYSLRCSVCQGEYRGKEEWTDHLSQSHHQFKARMECHHWRSEEKDCVLVAYCRFPVSSPSGRKLLQHLSKDLTTFVTDFVWREGNPRVALVQFESRKKAEQVLSRQCSKECPGRSQVLIDGHLAQLRSGSDLADVEWEVLRPEIPESPAVLLTQAPPVAANNDWDDQRIPQRMLQRVIIPGFVFNKALAVMEAVKKCSWDLSEKRRSPHVHMLRNWYLQLRNASSNELLIHLYYIDDDFNFDSESKGLSFINNQTALELLAQYPDRFKRVKNLNQKVEKLLGFAYLHVETGVQFRLTTRGILLGEVQRCRLLRYYCLLDFRVKRLLEVVHLWAIVNNVRLAEDNLKPVETPCRVPDPGGLEWMVVLYCCRKKLIPTPREVQGPEHTPLALKCGPDMGFSDDPQSAQLLKSMSSKVGVNDAATENVYDILELAAEFFHFVFKISAECCLYSCVLNTRDGEILRRDSITGGKHAVPLVTNLTNANVNTLRCDLANKKQAKSKKGITMVHPFNLKWRFSISDKRFMKTIGPQMGRTAAKLKMFAKECRAAEKLGHSPLLKSNILEDVLRCQNSSEKKNSVKA